MRTLPKLHLLIKLHIINGLVIHRLKLWQSFPKYWTKYLPEMKKISLFIVGFLVTLTSLAQELKCSVQVVHPKVQGTNTQIFQTLQNSIYEFMNNTKWTDNVFGNLERIESNILINVSEYDGNDVFVATIQVQSSRPVYNTSYNTVLLNYKEEVGEFRFRYIDQQSLEFNENTHLANLTSVLAFYAYIIIGLDYDSFSIEGGTKYFQKAQTIVNNAQSSSDIGWKAYESKKQNNRYFLIKDIMTKQSGSIRRVLYRYHRLGLDMMSQNTAGARSTIANDFKLLQRVYRERPNSLMLKIFFSAKSDEIINIFSEAQDVEKKQVYNIVKEIDLVNSTKYEKLIKK